MVTGNRFRRSKPGTWHLNVGQVGVANYRFFVTLEHLTADINKVTSLQALLCKAFRSPGVLVLGDFGIFCLFLPRASREVKINRKCLTCLPKQGSSATANNSHSELKNVGDT